jgi:hypothetical protein
MSLKGSQTTSHRRVKCGMSPGFCVCCLTAKMSVWMSDTASKAGAGGSMHDDWAPKRCRVVNGPLVFEEFFW